MLKEEKKQTGQTDSVHKWQSLKKTINKPTK